jgi:hypothetical protein
VRIKIGQKVRFDTLQHVCGYGVGLIKGNYVTGTVVMVNCSHKWFSVEYGEPKQRTSFNFCDIGSVVTVCG